jgi:hypothetical protein
MEPRSLVISSLVGWTGGNLILSNVREKILHEDDDIPAALGAITGLALLILINRSVKVQELCGIARRSAWLGCNPITVPLTISAGIVNAMGLRAMAERPQAILTSLALVCTLRVIHTLFAKYYAFIERNHGMQKFIILTCSAIPLDLATRSLYKGVSQPLAGVIAALFLATIIEGSRHYYHLRGPHPYHCWNIIKFSLPLIACVTLITGLVIHFFCREV